MSVLSKTVVEERTENCDPKLIVLPVWLFLQETRSYVKSLSTSFSRRELFFFSILSETLKRWVSFVRTTVIFPAIAIACKRMFYPYKLIFISLPFSRHSMPRRHMFFTVPSSHGRTSHLSFYLVIVCNKTITCEGIGNCSELVRKQLKLII